jgi:hypothetical protein
MSFEVCLASMPIFVYSSRVVQVLLSMTISSSLQVISCIFGDWAVLTFVNLHAFFSSPGKGVKSQLSQQLSTNIARQRRCVLLWNLCGAVVRLQGEHGSWGLVPLPAVLICMCECWRETALVLVKMHPCFGIGRSQSHWAQKVSMWFVNF